MAAAVGVPASADLAHQLAHSPSPARCGATPRRASCRRSFDDWCGTGWPRKFPLPVPGPDPDPYPWLEAYAPLGQLVGATVLASAATRLRDDDLGRVLADAADRLAQAALPDQAPAVTARPGAEGQGAHRPAPLTEGVGGPGDAVASRGC